jgi:hypothetical protein
MWSATGSLHVADMTGGYLIAIQSINNFLLIHVTYIKKFKPETKLTVAAKLWMAVVILYQISVISRMCAQSPPD